MVIEMVVSLVIAMALTLVINVVNDVVLVDARLVFVEDVWQLLEQ